MNITEITGILETFLLQLDQQAQYIVPVLVFVSTFILRIAYWLFSALNLAEFAYNVYFMASLAIYHFPRMILCTFLAGTDTEILQNGTV